LTEKQQQILKFIEDNPGAKQKDVCDALGFRRGAVRRAIKAGKREEGLTTMNATEEGKSKDSLTMEVSDSNTVITTRSADIKTLEDALAYAKVDLNVWDVDHYIVNSWEVTMGKRNTDTGSPETMTNFQVKIWLIRKVKKIVTDSVTLVTESMRQYAPKYPIILHPISKSNDDIMLEISPFDIHLGMLAWKLETGADWDINIAVETLRNAVREILSRASNFPINKILIPIGQDFYHLNSTEYVTPKSKNVLSVDGRFPKIYLSGYECMRGMIDDCLSIAPVEVVYVPGNHDQATSFTLCHALFAHYGECKDVTVDLSPKIRKAVTHGRVLLGFTHGQSEHGRDLPMLFASEFREQFGKCNWFEIHTGHLHKMRETRITTGDSLDGSTRVRILPSLASLEAYAYEAGYTSQQCCEAYIWSASDAYLGHLSVNARSLT
jgi:hypothetical protein